MTLLREEHADCTVALLANVMGRQRLVARPAILRQHEHLLGWDAPQDRVELANGLGKVALVVLRLERQGYEQLVSLLERH